MDSRRGARLLANHSLETTGKDVVQISAAASMIAPGTVVNIAFLGNESHAQRWTAIEQIEQAGAKPVPIVSARRLRSEADLQHFLREAGQRTRLDQLFLVGGDPQQAAGDFNDAMALVESPLLTELGIVRAGVAGYPQGHPRIDEARLWQALQHKVSGLQARGIEVEIVTQLCFSADAVVEWVARVRQQGIQVPIRVGVAGPVSVQRLLRYARQFGVASSARIVQQYGFSLTSLLGSVGPGKFLDELADGLEQAGLQGVGVHLYSFGGIEPGLQWVQDYTAVPEVS